MSGSLIQCYIQMRRLPTASTPPHRTRKDIQTTMRIQRVGPLGPLFVLLCFLAVLPARASEPAYISLNAGPIEIFDPDTRAHLGAEVRFTPRRYRWFPRFLPDLSPTAGALFGGKGTLYAYAGARCDLPLGGAWELSPQLAAGIYSHGKGIDLGGALEFRSGIEISRALGGRSRAGLLLFHLSNAGLYLHNPGTEGLVFTWSLRP